MKKRYAVDLKALHQVCDENYWRLQRLLPTLLDGTDDQTALSVSHAAGVQSRVIATVLERAPFTTTLHLVEQANAQPYGAEFMVQLYRDALMAEVTSYQNAQAAAPRYAYPNAEMRQPDEKAQWNFLLGEWLLYCLKHGHTEAWHYQPRDFGAAHDLPL